MSFFDLFKIKEYKDTIQQLTNDNKVLQQKYSDLGMPDYEHMQELIKDATNNYNNLLAEIELVQTNINNSQDKLDKLSKSITTQSNKLNRLKELVRAVQYALENPLSIDSQLLNKLNEYAPTITLKLHCMDVKELRKAYKENDKQINKLLESYSSRYTTKANQAIYQLMVIALRAELQNILYNLKYQKLDAAIEDVKAVSKKYLEIAGSGNQNIVNTLTRFIGEIEYLFINAVKIEYNYYVKKEQARQEQLALREQMRQEAEERKSLLAEQKKVEQEESKYTSEIAKLNEQLSNANENEITKLNERILQLQAQLSEVVIKKSEISKLANGKAGNVYIISNLGSFGDNVFKIGMTRRLDPQDRVNELGDASVPFKFDVHSFIFSNDAVGLENKLHSILDAKRVNKVNRRKEFFYCTIDELEELVLNIEPTAEFNKTMLAEEFYQSQSSDETYTSDYMFDDECDEDD